MKPTSTKSRPHCPGWPGREKTWTTYWRLSSSPPPRFMSAYGSKETSPARIPRAAVAGDAPARRTTTARSSAGNASGRESVRCSGWRFFHVRTHARDLRDTFALMISSGHKRTGSRFGQRRFMLPQKAQLVPITALGSDSSLDHVKEAAASQAEWITPFENGPFAVLEQVLDNARHLPPLRTPTRHCMDGSLPSAGDFAIW